METDYIPEEGNRLLTEVQRAWREKPVMVVLGALGVGLLIGAAVRSLQPQTREEEVRSRLHDTEEYVRDLVESLTKASKKGYRKSASAMKETLEKAVDAARDVDVDDYVDPATKWFRGIWKKCCR